jgi:hypothetical protein
MVQNKMHWAITGMTAAEIIHEHAYSSKPNMGLSNWRGEKAHKDCFLFCHLVILGAHTPWFIKIKESREMDSRPFDFAQGRLCAGTTERIKKKICVTSLSIFALKE